MHMTFFSIVIKNLRVDWQPKHIVNVGLFEATKVANETLGKKRLTKLLGAYGLKKKILTFVKDKLKVECYNN